MKSGRRVQKNDYYNSFPEQLYTCVRTRERATDTTTTNSFRVVLVVRRDRVRLDKRSATFSLLKDYYNITVVLLLQGDEALWAEGNKSSDYIVPPDVDCFLLRKALMQDSSPLLHPDVWDDWVVSVAKHEWDCVPSWWFITGNGVLSIEEGLLNHSADLAVAKTEVQAAATQFRTLLPDLDDFFAKLTRLRDA